MLKFIKTALVAGLLLATTHAIGETTTDVPLQLKGKLTQGALLLGKTAPTAKVELNGDAVTVTPEGHFVIGFARKAELEQQLTVTLKGATRTQTLQLSEREYNIERVDGVPQRTVTPDPEQVKRTKREAAKVWKARQTKSQRNDFLTPLVKPAEGRISGYYGSQRILNGEPRNPHYGEDIAAPTGTPVKAPWSGVVTLAEPDLFYSGGTIIIDHGYRVNTTYLHLNSVDVSVGDTIEQGDVIGTIGATGRATGPHLDWRVNWGNERLDPSLLPALYQQPLALD
ncbi:murein DD-endopeptidase MepM/ murein hydrolase activator NlpD [Idiomarina aquatica]|uniref:Murein DD-endopeptidase MepM/ murein hydrolase activator NlpD n=1 Tax=Idiomarina aquatica TaxID=1327752 RepID=A0A4R6PRC1_9GAMM|nr:M23 family metallopeptidase [Idiomarina aquatica]TDP40661.1 murein DD-endopeptidase MepM/ murein hydrolase activator NlpD [Idiomarina aquatica]